MALRRPDQRSLDPTCRYRVVVTILLDRYPTTTRTDSRHSG